MAVEAAGAVTQNVQYSSMSLDWESAHPSAGVFRASSEACDSCRDAGTKCERSSPFRFRAVSTVSRTTRDGTAESRALTYTADQTWVKIPQKVSFVTPGIDVDQLQPDASATSPGRESPGCRSLAERPPSLQEVTTPDIFSASSQHHQSEHGLDNVLPSPFSISTPPVQIDTRVVDDIRQHAQDLATPEHGGEYLSRAQVSLASDITASPGQVLHQPGAVWPFQSREEAQFFVHYVRNLASWVDVCDARCHFGTEVLRRASNFPLLTYAILAFSSRHLSLLSGTEDAISADYYSNSLQILIPILDDPIGALNGDILAAIVILRLYEEMTDLDTGCHLFGSSRLLNSISSFASMGGLSEAASWVSLRQNIYFALTNSQPLYIHLENYKSSSSFTGSDEEYWANRAVFLFAQVLAYAFQPDADLDIDTWDQLDQDVEKWHESKPWHFAPLWVELASIDDASAFPTIWMSRPAHIVGYQHYCLARMLLAVFNPHLSKPGFETFRRRREAEDTVLSNLRLVIGLAVSNSSVINASFTASHILQACGSYLKDPKEQDQALRFLIDMESRTGWRTSHIANNLRAQRSHSTDGEAFGSSLRPMNSTHL